MFFLWPIVDVVEPFIFSTLAGPPHCDNNGATVVFDVVACFKGRLKLSAQQLDKTPQNSTTVTSASSEFGWWLEKSPPTVSSLLL